MKQQDIKNLAKTMKIKPLKKYSSPEIEKCLFFIRQIKSVAKFSIKYGVEEQYEVKKSMHLAKKMYDFIYYILNLDVIENVIQYNIGDFQEKKSGGFYKNL